MRTLKVDTRIHPPAYSSASDAILSETRNPRAKMSSLDSTLIAGCYINTFRIGDDTVCLFLSNRLYLILEVVADRVEWRITNSESSGMNDVTEPFRLTWPDGAVTFLDTPGILEKRISCPLQKLFAGQLFVNLYFAGAGAIQFLPLWNVTDSKALLYASELELGFDASLNAL